MYFDGDANGDGVPDLVVTEGDQIEVELSGPP
jgi:hypothetical protein